MSVDTQKLVVRSGVKVEIARYTGGVLGTYSIIHPRGSVTVNSSYGSQTYADFTTALTDIAAMAPDGQRTASVTFNTYLIPTDTSYTNLYDAHDDAEEIALRVTFTDRAGSATAAVRSFKGYLMSVNETGNQDGAAESSITFNASAKLGS